MILVKLKFYKIRDKFSLYNYISNYFSYIKRSSFKSLDIHKAYQERNRYIGGKVYNILQVIFLTLFFFLFIIALLQISDLNIRGSISVTLQGLLTDYYFIEFQPQNSSLLIMAIQNILNSLITRSYGAFTFRIGELESRIKIIGNIYFTK